MFDLKKIKSRINCVDYAQRNGLPIRRSGDRCKSPLRPGAANATAFVVYYDSFFDFGSYTGGDVIDFAAELNHKGDRGLAIYELAKLTGVQSNDNFFDWKQATQKRNNLIQTWYEDLRPQDVEYLHSRNITDETIKRLRIGYSGQGITIKRNGETLTNFGAGRLIVPYYKNNEKDSYVFSWVGRALTDNQQPKYIKLPNDEFTENLPWGTHTLNRKNDDLYIAEGTFDALSLEQEGLPVIATMGGFFNKDTLKYVYNICKNYKKVILTFDNDEAGIEFAKKLGTLLFRQRIAFDIAEIPAGFKDISEYYTSGGDLKKLRTKNGTYYLASIITDKEEYTRFAYSAARALSKPDLAEMFEYVQRNNDTLTAAWLKETLKQCYKAPSDKAIADEIIAKYELCYVNGAGFYEYHKVRGLWIKRLDTEIHGYILDTLGLFGSGARLTPILNSIKPYLLVDDLFNKQPVICFPNGTLELETGNFRENLKEDYCSIQMSYPYDPEAKCPQWNSFIKQIMLSDEKKMDALQQIAGYVLFPDCRFERIFVLTGEGGNGKSIYTKTIEQLFGRENISNITPPELNERFCLIGLRDSMVNIAGEIRADLAKAEERLKQIASGEMLKDCYKGKDQMTFHSRAKLIFACNGQLRANDTSKGLQRRLLIIDFPCEFVDDPDPNEPLQFQRDIFLESKLASELTGIFNWAYNGYKMLLRTNYMTVPDEHKELLDEFNEATNSMISFVKNINDFDEPEYTYKALYDLYKDWCNDTNHKPLSDYNFYREFKKVAKKDFEPFERSIRVEGKPRKIRGVKRIDYAPKIIQEVFDNEMLI